LTKKLLFPFAFIFSKKVSIDAVGIFAYEYSLQVGGKAYEKFREEQKKALQAILLIS
jgi:hypothetical protein